VRKICLSVYTNVNGDVDGDHEQAPICEIERFLVQGSEFMVLGSTFGVQGSGFPRFSSVQSSDPSPEPSPRTMNSEHRTGENAEL
jgi:hypothetical protein